jgi:hypothetical protein
MSDGSVRFEFQRMSLEDLRRINPVRPERLVRWCYEENRDLKSPEVKSCAAR